MVKVSSELTVIMAFECYQRRRMKGGILKERVR
jgi:hypothetical protein